MAQSKPDLISRQELLALIRDHAEAIKDTDPRQHAVLAYWQTVVEALPAKAVAVEVVHCGECEKWTSAGYPCKPDLGICYLNNARPRNAHEFCSRGKRRADHGKD